MTHKTICSVLPVLAENHIPVGNQRVVTYLGFDKKFVFGFNRLKSHPLQKRFSDKKGKILLHAEIDAIRQFVNKYDCIRKAVLYVCRVSAIGKMCLGKPCRGCQDAIDIFGIKKVYYSSPSGFLTED